MQLRLSSLTRTQLHDDGDPLVRHAQAGLRNPKGDHEDIAPIQQRPFHILKRKARHQGQAKGRSANADDTVYRY